VAERVKVLGVPCPWTGDDNDPIPPSYWWWYRLYRSVRVVRHRLGLHDWSPQWRGGDLCGWCGERR